MFHAYSQPDDCLNEDVVSTVEITMKKHTDGVVRFLEGISSRLSQLELYCYNLDKSMVEMRSDLVRDHGEADTKLKSLEKHLQEVHRSVQILRDKQELAETQKELAKLQLVQKDSSSSSHSQSNEERASPAASEPKRGENTTADMQNQQLALALPHQVAPQQQPVAPLPQTLPHQVAPQQQPVAPTPQTPPQNVTHQQSYYMPATQLPNPPAPAPAPIQQPQSQYMSTDPQYRPPPLPDSSRVTPQPQQSQPNPVPHGHHFLPQYQQQWPQQVQQTQQPTVQPQIRPSPTVYPSYPPSQPSNPSPPEMLPNSAPMQVQYTGVPQPVSTRADVMPYGYGAPGRPVPQQPPPLQPQPIKGNYGAQPGDGYAAAGPRPTLPPGSGYMMYDSESGRTPHPPQQSHFAQGGYPSQPTTGSNLLARNPSQPQFIRNHTYSELIENLVSMGYRGDHAASVIQRMEESGQPVDFNAVLDRLNVHSSGGSQRGGWSG